MSDNDSHGEKNKDGVGNKRKSSRKTTSKTKTSGTADNNRPADLTDHEWLARERAKGAKRTVRVKIQ